MYIHQALNFALEGARQFSYCKGHSYEENVNLYWNFAKGTTAKAQGTTAVAVGYFKARYIVCMLLSCSVREMV